MDLITKLLIKNPQHRLTSPSEIKAHPFFRDIDWRAMVAKELRPPYKPQLETGDDTKHFDQEICKIPIDSPSLGGLASQLSPCDEDEFDGFTFEARTQLSGSSPVKEY